MSGELGLFVSAASESLKTVPQAYDDAARPAVREVGKTLGLSARALLAPLTLPAFIFGLVLDNLEQELEVLISHVPPERRVTPQANVVIPAVQGWQICKTIPELREMYEKLIFTAMDSRTSKDAHPSFVEIIRQITPDEAKLLRLFTINDGYPIINLHSVLNTTNGWQVVVRNFSFLGVTAGCMNVELMPTYLDNLQRLGVIEVSDSLYLEGNPGYDALKNHPSILAAVEQVKTDPTRHPKILDGLVRVTTLGKQFVNACVTQEGAAI